jgi:hypothetical protein
LKYQFDEQVGGIMKKLKDKTWLIVIPIILLGACAKMPTPGEGGAYIIALPAISGEGKAAGDPYPQPASELEQYYDTPPQAILKVDQGEQVAALGSYCWTQEVRNGAPVEKCLDRQGIPTPQTFLPVNHQFTARLRLLLPVKPAGVSLFYMPVYPADALGPPADEIILWPYREGETIFLSNIIEQDLELELNPGLNVLYVNARWDDLGSVDYGFLLEVKGP